MQLKIPVSQETEREFTTQNPVAIVIIRIQSENHLHAAKRKVVKIASAKLGGSK